MAKYLDDLRVGDDFLQKITVSKPVNGVDTPVDLTGYKFWITVKTNVADLDADAVLQVSTTAGDHPADDEVNGIVYLYIPASVTKTVPAGEYFYDVQMMQPGGGSTGITTLVPPPACYDDKLTFYPEITRATA